MKQGALAIAAVLVVVAVSIALARMEPAAPTVERATVLIDTVKRGSIVRQVRGLGQLVPEDSRWLPAPVDGHVERVHVRPGAQLRPDTIILELSNPQIEQDVLNARLALASAEANLDNLRITLLNESLQQQVTLAGLEADFEMAQLTHDANETLATQDLVSDLALRQSQRNAETARLRLDLQRKTLESARQSAEARVRVQQSAVDRERGLVELQERRLTSLRVTPGFSGILQQLDVEIGHRIASGAPLALVTDPTRLKARLRIAETQARDVEVGQPAQIDTRNGIVAGIVSHKDPAAVNGTVVVDVTLTDALPRGAVPDLSVDGTIQLERVDDVLYVGRPSLGQEQSTVGLYRVTDESGHATRTQVRLGVSSVSNIEVVSGLEEGDQVVLSDMSAYDAFDRVRLR